MNGCEDRRAGDGRHSIGGGGFTLVEMLIVISIIGLLAALLLPAVQSARESARRVECVNNLKQLALGVITYESALGQYPPAYVYEPGRHNYVNFILPYLEQRSVHIGLDFDVNYDDPPNTAVTETDLPLMICPSSPDARRGRWKGDYATCDAINADFHDDLVAAGVLISRVDPTRPSRIRREALRGMLQRTRSLPAQVRDGLSNSFMLFEDAGRPKRYESGRAVKGSSPGSRWADPTAYFVIHQSKCGLTRVINCTNNNEIYAFHVRGANFAYGDGSVRFHDQDMDIEPFVSLFTRAAGDVAGAP